MGKFTKVMKYELNYLQGAGDFHQLQEILWRFQRQTREILNKMIREIYLSEKFNNARYMTLYHQFREEYPDVVASTVNATMQEAKKKYNSAKKDIFIGAVSLPSYKSDQPILLHNQTVKITEDEANGEYAVRISLLSDNFHAAHPETEQPVFRLLARDKNQRVILQRVLSGEYKIGQSQLIYRRPKWFLNLTYCFEKEPQETDADKILGVDLGCVYALYASSFGMKGTFKIPGSEITAFERKQAAMQGREPRSTLDRIEELEQRRWEKQQQARYCGDGRIGHGTKTRVAPAYKDEDRIARFRDTINHRYSKALVEYARKNGFGTIQMEDLSGIKEDTEFPKRLRHWTYFDLQTKIESKAKEAGIRFVKIDPSYTSQRCSRCGHIDSKNRRSQSDFRCVKCGFQGNADYNASQNISIPEIDKVIKESMKKQNANIE